MQVPENGPFALFDDATWPDRPALLLHAPEGLVEAWRADEVPGALAAIDAAAARGLWAAGYCAYELGYVFEPRLLPLLPATGRPLLRFHLFGAARRLSPGARYRWLSERVSGAPIAGAFSPALDAAAHGTKVARVRQLIADGDVYQVNLTFKLSGPATGDPIATYAALRSKARSGACALLRFADEDVLSFSPELFFRAKDGRINARPMKGTRGRAGGIAEDAIERAALLADEKQRAENLMIVDLLRNDLSRLSTPGSVKVDDLFTVETYPRFHTLTSGISATLDGDVSFERMLKCLFPCGSVTGAPKIRAMEIIRDVEEAPRGVYCGAVGFVARGAASFNVAIRTLVLREGRAELGVGGGIVWDSRAAAEYDECLLKARFLTEPTEPIRLIETMRWTPDEGFHLLDLHLSRLSASSRYFGFVCDAARIRRALDKAVAGMCEMQRVRLTLGERGDVEVETAAFAPNAANAVWRYAWAESTVDSNDWRVRHKTTARDFYDRALAASGADEVVFTNERGEVTEGSRSNVFVERDGTLVTPPLAAGLLDGCLRRSLIASGRAVEGTLTRSDMERGQVWFGNSLRGLIRGERAAPSVASAAQ